jgi:4-carboxymuconolactone decarboxylase
MTVPPGDIYPDSRNRLPLVDRDRLDDAGNALYDSIVNDPHSLAGLQGPGGIKLHAARFYAIQKGVNRFLRFDAGLDRRLAELMILVTAREMDAAFEWNAHEAQALREGLEQHVIDIVRKRGSVRGLGPSERTIVRLGREAIGKHRVRRKTYAAAIDLFGAEMLVHVVALMGEYAAAAILLAVFAQQLPPGAVHHLDRA